MIKIIMGLIIIIIAAPLARYYHLDNEFNDSIITNQIKVDAYEIYDYIFLNDNWML